MMLRRLLLAAALAGAAPTTARPVDDLQEGDALVQTIGWKLAQASADLCTRVSPATGLLLGDARTFNDAAAARDAYGLTGDVAVAAVAENGPAARAGLQANDTVVALAGTAVAALPLPRPGAWDRMLALQDRLEQAAARDGHVDVTLGDGRTVTIAAQPACTVRFMLDDDKGYARSTRADVRIGRHFYEDTRGDPAVFAAIIAHELAHSVLDHQSRIEQRPRPPGIVRRTEQEADRLSVWLLARAGYDPQAAVRLMETVLRRRELLSIDPSHGSWKTRARVIAAEITAMKAAPDLDWSRHFRRET